MPVHIYPDNELPLAYGDIYKFCNTNLHVSQNNRHLLAHRHILLTVIDEIAYFVICSSSSQSRQDALQFEPNGTVLDIIPDGEGIGNCFTVPTHINCNDVHSFPVAFLDDMNTDGVIEINGSIDKNLYEQIKSSILFSDDDSIYDSMTWGNSYP